VSALYPAGMSPEAERLTFLRLQRVDLDHAFEVLQAQSTYGRSQAARMAKKARENLRRVDELLRDLGNFIITGRYA
jgi:hypothetical protein